MRKRMVIDASVAAKWFLKDEDDCEAADKVLVDLLAEEIEGHAPRVFSYEVPGLLAKACKNRGSGGHTTRLDIRKAVECIKVLFGLGIKIAESSIEEAIESVQMAVEYEKQSYDMAYLRLARKLDCQWCTADGKVLKACPPAFPTDSVLLLSSLPSD